MTAHAAGSVPVPAAARRRRGPLEPAALVFGVSATGYRCEGGFNGPGQPENQWAAWERVGAARSPDRGCHLWSYPEPAIERAAAAGARVLAVGVEWARVEPEPGSVDGAALDRYAEILGMASQHGIEPVVTLQDIAHPRWLGDEHWLTPGAPDLFARHAARVASRLAGVCRRWVTVRQPNHLAVCGWVTGSMPPRRVGALSDAWAVLDNLCSAHVLAYDAIHEVDPEAVVAMGVRRASSYDAHRLALDLVSAPGLGVRRDALDAWVDERRVVHDLALPPHDLAELAGRLASRSLSPYGGRSGPLRRRSPRRAVDVAFARAHEHTGPPLDALWLVWRPGGAVGRGMPPGSPGSLAGDAEALRSWCVSQQELTPELPLWIEDGIALGVPGVTAPGATAPGTTAPGATASGGRPGYLRASLRGVSAAREAGSHVEGYVYHCIGPDSDAVLAAAVPVLSGVARCVARSIATFPPSGSSPDGHPPASPLASSGARREASRAPDYGLFDVVASTDAPPRWQEVDATGTASGAELRRLVEEIHPM